MSLEPIQALSERACDFEPVSTRNQCRLRSGPPRSVYNAGRERLSFEHADHGRGGGPEKHYPYGAPFSSLSSSRAAPGSPSRVDVSDRLRSNRRRRQTVRLRGRRSGRLRSQRRVRGRPGTSSVATAACLPRRRSPGTTPSAGPQASGQLSRVSRDARVGLHGLIRETGPASHPASARGQSELRGIPMNCLRSLSRDMIPAGRFKPLAMPP